MRDGRVGGGVRVVVRPAIHKDDLGLSPAEVGASGEFVLAVFRDDVVQGFDTRDVRILQKGVQLVVIRHSEGNGYHVTPPPAS